MPMLEVVPLMCNSDVIASASNPCTGLQEILDEIKPPEGQTKERAFLGNMDQQLKDNAGLILPELVSTKQSFSKKPLKMTSHACFKCDPAVARHSLLRMFPDFIGFKMLITPYSFTCWSVGRLSKVQVIQRDGLPKPLLYLIGYGVPFVIVGVSAMIYSDGYGATECEYDKQCWLPTQHSFNWALTGPVIVVLGVGISYISTIQHHFNQLGLLNWVLFCASLWSLRPTLATMKSDVSQSKDTSLRVSLALCPGGFYVYKPLDYAAYTGYVTCPCDVYTNITEPWRNRDFTSTTFPGYPKNDANLVNNWWRFTGIGGDRVVTNCIGNYLGGTYYMIYIPFAYPTNESATPTTGNAYGYVTYCNGITFSVSVALCPGGFYVYKPEQHPYVYMGYVTYHYTCGNNSCGPLAQCTDYGGCICISGYEIPSGHQPTPVSYGCTDIDECQRTLGICGPYSECTNTNGSYFCTCFHGYSATNPGLPPGGSNKCTDIDECLEDICGEGICLNSAGSFMCNCYEGYQNVPDATPLCQDIDECEEDATVCGPNSNCTNSIGSYSCTCFPGFRLNKPDVIASVANPCTDIQDILDAIVPLEEVSGVRPQSRSVRVSSEGDGETGSVILGISDRLVSAMVPSNLNDTKKKVQTSTVDLSLRAIGPGAQDDQTFPLSAKGQTMEINLKALASNNNGSAAVAFMTLTGMESLLSHQYFKTENKTEMYSDVFTAILPEINNTSLSEPVNFTIQHKKKVPKSGIVTCVYWEDKRNKEEGQGVGETMRWSVEGCWVTYTDENYTVCSCSHLSTFALIMQIGEPPPDNSFLEWLNRMCVIVGLFFFGLAIFTFLLCSWNPKINNTARLHLCLNLAMSHLLLLWNDRYVNQKLACKVMAGLLHFLVVASFVWMLLEALQLHLLVRRLSKVQVIQRDGLPKPLLYLIGYGVPFVIVGVSALIYSDGYGATEAAVCWLSRMRGFNWALTGPVIVILGLNWMLFCATLWSLRPTLANMKSDVSQSKDTRLIVFKILAQFVILGCTWILGLYQTNLFFQVLFILLNSQQGTFLYIVHCLLNKEVREEYIKWLTCTCGKDRSAVSHCVTKRFQTNVHVLPYIAYCTSLINQNHS
ncbi:hypothetical protein L3Q82_014304 [Scortum barcoo]|uniref:Uncharacterized protein n=1 Tax=Scortum barcoo TaxID=214431 RepID=A0ACB8VWP3_9TELE|nr:hypothetical protein L3Q82_014304 [Scortum barcoo]